MTTDSRSVLYPSSGQPGRVPTPEENEASRRMAEMLEEMDRRNEDNDPLVQEMRQARLQRHYFREEA